MSKYYTSSDQNTNKNTPLTPPKPTSSNIYIGSPLLTSPSAGSLLNQTGPGDEMTMNFSSSVPNTPGSVSAMLNGLQNWPIDDLNILSSGTARPMPLPPKPRPESAQIDPNGQKTELVGLDMSGFNIRSLSLSLFKNFTFLTELRLSNNSIKEIPFQIGMLRQLAYLDLSKNKIKSLPREIGWLTGLRELLLYENQIQDLPPELGYLFQLETFGIDHNPLRNESILTVLHNQGSLAIIPFLRDHMITLMPPIERTWHILEPVSGPSITILCYNILSDKYASPQLYGYVPTWFLNWEYRKQLIFHEIISYDSDIICLQEVESSQFDQFFKPQLKMRLNYDGVFSPKSRAKTMGDWERNFVDGCAIFFKNDKFRLEDKHLIEFNQLALARPSLRKHRDMYNRVMTRDNISLIVRLEHKETRHEIIISNVHIHWDPIFCDVKLVQTIMLLEELEKICSRHPKASLVVCGDFNSLPDSGVVKFLNSGDIEPKNRDFLNHTYEPYSTEGAKHSLNLQSTYTNCPDPPSFTNFTPSFAGVIDYIWYRGGGLLKPIAMLGPIPVEYTRQIVGLPTQHIPSDHIPLLVEFKLDLFQQQPSQFSNLMYNHSSHLHRSSGDNVSGSKIASSLTFTNNHGIDQSFYPGKRLYSRNKSFIS